MGSKFFKGITFLIFALLFGVKSESQIVTIPDPEMVSFFTINYPSCIVGDQLDTSCPDILAATLVSVAAPIYDLTGLQYFVNAQKIVLINVMDPIISELPDGVENLHIMSCAATQITGFPSQAQKIWITEAYALESIAPFPSNLNELTIWGGGYLTSIPELPTGLDSLTLYWNSLTSLPNLPNGLLYLYLEEAGITCLPELPNSLLSCPTPGEFNFTSTQITCVPNIPPAITITNGYDICVPGDVINNPNNCVPNGSSISGFIYEDFSNPCIYDSGLDFGLEGVKVFLIDETDDTAQITYTNTNGYYYFDQLLSGDYTVAYDTTEGYYVSGCVDAPVDSLVSVVLGTNYENVNFNSICPGYYDAIASGAWAAGSVFPGQNHNLYALQSLQGCSAGPATIKLVLDGPVNYLSPASGALTPTLIDGDTLWYDIPVLSLLAPFDISVTLNTETTATLGDSVCVEFTIQTTGEDNTSNNTITTCYAVVNSYDPNVKYVSHEVVEPGYDDWLTYTFFFQNTGSAPAFDIVVKDTLSALLRHNTFEFLTASDPVEVHLYNDVVTFEFDDIMLPDSTSDPEGSIGFAQFRIKPQSGLPEGTEITNEVDIYFDFNPPITTDIVTTSYEVNDVSVPEKNVELKLYPNPAENEINVVINEHIETIQVLSLDGSVIMTDNKSIINIGSLANGVYLVQVYTSQGVYTTKVIKA